MRVQAFLSTPQLRTGPACRTGPAYAGEGSSDDDDDTRPTERLEPAADESRDQRALLERSGDRAELKTIAATPRPAPVSHGSTAGPQRSSDALCGRARPRSRNRAGVLLRRGSSPARRRRRPTGHAIDARPPPIRVAAAASIRTDNAAAASTRRLAADDPRRGRSVDSRRRSPASPRRPGRRAPPRRPGRRAPPRRPGTRSPAAASRTQPPPTAGLALKTSSRDAEDDRPARPSSGTARRRRTEERKLVEVLGRTTDGEQFQSAIDGLWQLWFSERGAANKAKLEAVDALLQGGDLAEACAAAEALCAEHGDWTEARNRLATIQFLRGDYEASIGNCERV